MIEKMKNDDNTLLKPQTSLLFILAVIGIIGLIIGLFVLSKHFNYMFYEPMVERTVERILQEKGL